MSTPSQETSADALTHVDDQSLVEALVWISATSKPSWLYKAPENVSEHLDMLIPENPLYYLWLLACHELNLLVVPLVPHSNMPGKPVWDNSRRYLYESVQLNLATVLLLEEGSTWQDCFLKQSQLISETMRSIATDQSRFTPLLSFYAQRGIKVAKELESLDMQLLMTQLSKVDALYTATAIAGEYVANDLGKNAIPATVLERLSQSTDIYQLMVHDMIEVGLVLPSKKFSSRLVPVSLYETRCGRRLDISMEEFALQGAVPRILVSSQMKQHAEAICQMLVREGTLPAARAVDEWKRQADKLVGLSTIMIRPFEPQMKLKRVPSGHETPLEEPHVYLLPSLKTWFKSVQGQGHVWTSRLEWDAVGKRLAYLVYFADTDNMHQDYIDTLKEMPWHDRWTFFSYQSWTRNAIEWIKPEGEMALRGEAFIAPTTMASAGVFARLCWWIEEHMRIMMGVAKCDMSADYDPIARSVCLSLYLPKSVEISQEWTASLDLLE